MYVLALRCPSFTHNLTFLLTLISTFSSTAADTNEKSRTLLKTKADEYLNRAEAIRHRVDVDTHKQPDRPGVAADVSGFSKGHTTAKSVILDVSAIVHPCGALQLIAE